MMKTFRCNMNSLLRYHNWLPNGSHLQLKEVLRTKIKKSRSQETDDDGAKVYGDLLGQFYVADHFKRPFLF